MQVLSDNDIENEIQSKNLNAPRLSPESIDSVVSRVQYHVFEGTTVTVCCLTLKNGYSVIGTGASVSSKNFDEEIGRQVAYRDAHDKIWQLEGYLLKQRLFEEES